MSKKHNVKIRLSVNQDKYESLRFEGESVKDEQYGMDIMLKYFRASGLTEEQLRQNMSKLNLNQMFRLVKSYFEREYGYRGEDIKLSNCYQYSVNSYAVVDKSIERFLHVDELFEYSMMAFFLVIFKWSKEFDNPHVYGDCFLYLLFLMNDVGILGDIPSGKSNEILLQTIKDDAQIMNLASSCYWTVVAFNLSHEMAHVYFEDSGRTFPNKRKEEYTADSIAYDIVLKIIVDQSRMDKDDRILEEYTYLAPLMYMNYFDLFYYTDRVLYDKRISSDTHPLPKDRIRNLFALANDDKYDFNTAEGNDLYNGFLDVYDNYRTELILKKDRGKLDKIIRTEKRAKREKKQEVKDE